MCNSFSCGLSAFVVYFLTWKSVAAFHRKKMKWSNGNSFLVLLIISGEVVVYAWSLRDELIRIDSQAVLKQ